MVRKRLIGTVIVKDGWAVQSFGFNKYLPLGKPECLVENLDRWGADEILVSAIDRSIQGLGPDFHLIEKLGKLGVSTPVIYAGGINSVEDGIRVIQIGADRIVLDSMLHTNLGIIEKLSKQLGSQAIIASLPVSIENNQLLWLDYKAKRQFPLPDKLIDFLATNSVSEIFLQDWQHEGGTEGFDERLVNLFPTINIPLIVFGGISEENQIGRLLKNQRVAAVASGNYLSYREHAIQSFRKNLDRDLIRSPFYETDYRK
jgi:cyclase